MAVINDGTSICYSLTLLGSDINNIIYFFTIKIMKAYKQFITAVGKLLGGDDDMEKRADEIVAFEKKLAKVINVCFGF